jgi:hypothetical protein
MRFLRDFVWGNNMKVSKISKRTKILICIALLLVVLALICVVIIQSNKSEIIHIRPSQYLEALTIEEIIELNDGDVNIRLYNQDWGHQAGEVRRISGIFSTATILTPKDAVIALTSVRDVFGIESFSYIVTEVSEGTFSLRQAYKGIEVWNGGFEVLATDKGVPLAVGGRYVNVGNIDVIPRISSDEVKDKYHLTWTDDGKPIALADDERLFIYITLEGEILLCWVFGISQLFFIDAHTGDFISVKGGPSRSPPGR